MVAIWTVVWCILFYTIQQISAEIPPEVVEFLASYNKEMRLTSNRAAEANWNFATNITDHNQQLYVQESLRASVFVIQIAREAAKIPLDNLDWDTRRQLTFIKDIGGGAQTDMVKRKKLTDIGMYLAEVYSKGKVCLSKSNCLQLDPGLTELFRTSRDYDVLKSAWKGWRDASGAKMGHKYAEFVDLSNEALRISGYEDKGEYWRSTYETPTFEEDVKKLFDQVLPLYRQLHAYVRRKLKGVYGADKFPETGHIPAHLLGNMWAQQWDGIHDLVQPFPNKQSPDVTEQLKQQNYTAKDMFLKAEEFFVSIGLDPMTKTFWEKSMLTRPKDGREVVCHGSAASLSKDKDFRIQMCTEVNQHMFKTIHHEMGHIEYYMQYDHQPMVYKTGANPGFHEAVGDTIGLSVMTPEHKHTIGLLKEIKHDEESELNYLMEMALMKIAFLPFGYLIDQWRWSVFRGDTKPHDYNKQWWKLRCGLQGISPPVPRSSSDFDPGAKYHVPDDTPYIRYFVSFIIQFQFHKALCDKAGHVGPLNRCDIYKNKDAGNLLKSMLSLGKSKPWPEAMKLMTGKPNMDAGPLMEYFKPLLDFLKKENGNDVGWKPECPDLEAESNAKKEQEETDLLRRTLLGFLKSLRH